MFYTSQIQAGCVKSVESVNADLEDFAKYERDASKHVSLCQGQSQFRADLLALCMDLCFRPELTTAAASAPLALLVFAPRVCS